MPCRDELLFLIFTYTEVYSPCLKNIKKDEYISKKLNERTHLDVSIRILFARLQSSS